MRRLLLCLLLTSIIIFNNGYISYADADESEYPDNNPITSVN